MHGNHAQNLLLKSQVSATRFYIRTVTFVRAWICTDDMRASRLQAKGRRYYLSQNIGPAVAGSAGPAPPPLVYHYQHDPYTE